MDCQHPKHDRSSPPKTLDKFLPKGRAAEPTTAIASKRTNLIYSLVAWIFFLGAVQLAHASNTVYKSTAPDGSIVYSDHPPTNGRVEKTFEFADLPSTPVPDSQPVQAAAPKKAAQKPQRIAPGGAALFSAVWCGYCKRAKAYLEQNGINYRNIDIDTEDGKAQFMNAGGGGIPLLFIGDRFIRGFSMEGYARFFGG